MFFINCGDLNTNFYIFKSAGTSTNLKSTLQSFSYAKNTLQFDNHIFLLLTTFLPIQDISIF